MAYDGFTIGCIKKEIEDKALGGRIYKIQQPEKDAIVLVIKNNSETMKLSISVDASLPLIRFTKEKEVSPLSAPSFLMLLRKHLGNGRLIDIAQPDNERILIFTVEHLDEMGDICRKKLIVEMMGRYSNIIFVDQDDMILDSIKHVSHDISSVREVLPGRMYVMPPKGDKVSPFGVTFELFSELVLSKPLGVAKSLSGSFSGMSYVTAAEICFRAGLDADFSTASLGEKENAGDGISENGIRKLYKEFSEFTKEAESGDYKPFIYFEGGEPKEFSVFPMSIYDALNKESYMSVSELLTDYYSKKQAMSRIRQKSSDLRQIINTSIERTARKLNLQTIQMKDTLDMEKNKVYGELINTYGYSLLPGAKSLTCVNYYDNKEVTIPLDETKSISENSQKYFERYAKKKRTKEALSTLIETTKNDLDYLLSVKHALSIAEKEEDINAIKDELIESRIIERKGRTKGKKNTDKSIPLHFVTEDGYDIYVGRNNIQNDMLTFKMANGSDMWFHAKKMPGSHVIVKRKDTSELPDHIYEIAAAVAAYYSDGKDSPRVEIDYTERKNLRKPPAANPGYVIYHTNYSLTIAPSLEKVKRVLDDKTRK